MKQHIVGAEHHVLHDAVFVTLELGVGRQLRWINRQHGFAVNRDLGQLAALQPGLRLAPLRL